ncbi:hypothetical protein JKP88DRAFT_197518 [Tribonema minus]|uniref:Isopenicillin N synthase-like Fe(2+) 2OG dioxygenase domain-containing protein n=1 Tax=Tribonema minus TaxID=303371 RepID=A0A835ZA03_9STRA|nr:hypothetical protein JKP88DRAFT_197518 [Tribonema minus]
MCTHRQAADSLHRYGVVLVRDPDVREEDNAAFIDMMERYYEQSDGVTDARPELSYQVGVTPGGVEVPRDHCDAVTAMPASARPATVCPPEADPKWRFFWRVGKRPSVTQFPELNAEPVMPDPKQFPDWSHKMDRWGGMVLTSLTSVAEMLAVGLKLPADAFSSRMKSGPHLLAPTGSDLAKHGQLGTVLAGYHTDLNFLTIHGKSRFPGLHIWLRDGRKCSVAVPNGALLVQAGKQLEHLTAGHIMAGFHEVCVTEATLKAIEQRKAAGGSTWRVSSTCFGHIASDQTLEPLERFQNEPLAASYPPIKAGEQVQEELRAISLRAPALSSE